MTVESYVWSERWPDSLSAGGHFNSARVARMGERMQFQQEKTPHTQAD